MSISDFVIHINENLTEYDVNDAEEAVMDCNGIISAHISPQHPHLMLVAYDPNRVSSGAALQAIHSLGFHGQMIGL